MLYEPRGVEFLPVSDKTTKDEAYAALDKLLHVVREFSFEQKRGEKTASRSVALACILTGIVRRPFLFAPGFAFDSPVPRTGKGKVLNIAHVLAFGHRAIVHYSNAIDGIRELVRLGLVDINEKLIVIVNDRPVTR